MKEIKLKISGMHCSSCEKIIEMDLSDLEGVQESKISSSTGEGLVKVDDSVSAENVINVIEKSGYKAKVTEI